jgi:hypothetical protein
MPNETPLCECALGGAWDGYRTPEMLTQPFTDADLDALIVYAKNHPSAAVRAIGDGLVQALTERDAVKSAKRIDGEALRAFTEWVSSKQPTPAAATHASSLDWARDTIIALRRDLAHARAELATAANLLGDAMLEADRLRNAPPGGA